MHPMFILALCLALPVSAFAQETPIKGRGIAAGAAQPQPSMEINAVNPPGSIDLNAIVTDVAGKPIKNFDKRELSVVVVKPFGDYQMGDVITDRGVIEQLAVPGGPNEFSVQLVDSQCDKCPLLDLRWALSQALTTRACPQQQQQANPMMGRGGEPEPAECTPEEKKAEGDVLTMTSRINKALELRGTEEKPGPASVAWGASTIKLVKSLVAVRYKTAPVTVWRVWSLIDPNGTPAAIPEFGKEP